MEKPPDPEAQKNESHPARYVPLGVATLLACIAYFSSSEVNAMLLDWPFLLFVTFALVITLTGRRLGEVILTRQFEFGKDGIKLGARIDELEVETGEDLKSVLKRLEKLENPEEQDDPPPPLESVGGEPKDEDRRLYDKMVDAIRHSRFTWRSLERLAILTGVQEKHAAQILEKYGWDEVTLGASESGRRIARLK